MLTVLPRLDFLAWLSGPLSWAQVVRRPDIAVPQRTRRDGAQRTTSWIRRVTAPEAPWDYVRAARGVIWRACARKLAGRTKRF